MKNQELDPLITECPHCDTRFRVTENQLALADGRVRCGACLTVFQGAEYLQLEGGLGDSEEADRTLDEVLSELDEDELEEQITQVPEEQPASATGNSGKSVATEEFSDQNTENADSEEGDPGALIQDTQEFSVFSGQEDELELFPSNSVSLKPFLILSDTEETIDEGDAQGSAKDVDQNIVEEIGLGSEAATDEPASQGSKDVSEAVLTSIDIDNLEVEPAAIEALYSQLHFAEKPRSRWIPWVFLIGALAITAQVFYYQFDTWGKNDSLRPVYGLVCEVIGCELPVIRSLADIRSRSSSVRPHDQLANVLTVEALIVNEAEFAQPFPTVELRFTTLLGNLVTTYHFKPKDYLEGELTGVVEMQPLQPVRIAFEVPDPGKEAENYSLNFL